MRGAGNERSVRAREVVGQGRRRRRRMKRRRTSVLSATRELVSVQASRILYDDRSGVSPQAQEAEEKEEGDGGGFGMLVLLLSPSTSRIVIRFRRLSTPPSAISLSSCAVS